jgi:hypothetical protein
MYRECQRGTGRTSAASDPDPFWPLAVLLAAAALILALPALALGFALGRLTTGRPWSIPLWLALTIAGLGLIYVFSTHGLEQLITAQLVDVVLAVKKYRADLPRWDLGRLWSLSWPVWLRTLPLTPAVACWRELETRAHRSGAAWLQRQERERARHAARAHKRAARRARHPNGIRDAVAGHMVVGVPIDDDDIA